MSARGGLLVQAVGGEAGGGISDCQRRQVAGVIKNVALLGRLVQIDADQLAQSVVSEYDILVF